MKAYSGKQLKDYISSLQQYAMKQTGLSCVYERDFVDYIRQYCFGDDFPMVYIVCGLRATGKTFGLLQAVGDPDDTIYIQAQLGESLAGEDYIEFLKNVKEKNIIIDEYSWIKDNHDLSCYLWTLAENGKRIAITGTHSLALNYLESGELIHRAHCINVNLFSYEEFCRVYQKPYCKSTVMEFLKTGGIFKEYALLGYNNMRKYLQEAVIDDLTKFIKLPQEVAKAIVYDIIYLAVCDSNVTKVQFPDSRRGNPIYRRMLETFDVDPSIEITPTRFKMVSETLEDARFILKTYNFCNRDEYRLHMVNPALTYQMVSVIFDEKSADERLGKAFEAYLVSQMFDCTKDGDDIRYIDMGQLKGQPELELVIINPDDDLAYLFDAKLREAASLSENSSLVSDKLEKALGCLAVGGRYVVGNSPTEKCGMRNGRKVIFTRLDCKTLQNYRDFDENYIRLQSASFGSEGETEIF